MSAEVHSGHVEATTPEGRTRKPSRSRGRVLRLVRRVHLYAGLLLLPWLLFFGLSGILFNHPNVGEDVRGQRIGAQDLAGFAAWQPEEAAGEVLAELNAEGPQRFTLDRAYTPHFAGYSVLRAPARDGNYMMLLDVATAKGVLVERTARKNPQGSSFPARELSLPRYSSEAVAQHARGLLRARKLPHEQELEPHPAIAPELRLRVADRDGQRWNLSYDTRTGVVSGRRTESFPNLGVAQILGSMHKTHHFTFELGALWFWALFEDLLGATMVIWALTGLVMWWQVKRTRIAGIASILIALAVAGVIMSGTLESLTFGDVRATNGPGE